MGQHARHSSTAPSQLPARTLVFPGVLSVFISEAQILMPIEREPRHPLLVMHYPICWWGSRWFWCIVVHVNSSWSSGISELLSGNDAARRPKDF